MMTQCEYSNPVTYTGAPATKKQEIFNFKTSNCSTTDLSETIIQNIDTGAEFYLDKKISYGDVFLFFCLTLAGFYLIFKACYHFFWKK